MSGQFYWTPAALILPQGGGMWRIFNPPVRRNLLATEALLPLVDALVGGIGPDALERLHAAQGERLRVADAGAFTLWDSPHRNPDLYDTTLRAEDCEALPYDEFLDLLTELALVTDTPAPAVETDKRSFTDRLRGNFYEQIGTEALFQRTPPEAWWTHQKFSEDLSEVRPNAYRHIEERFLDDYLPEALAGKEVLEIGSGTGYFTAKMSAHAELAIGLDYNADYVAAACRTWTVDDNPRLEFVQGDVIKLDSCAGISGRLFDAIVMIDMFLFLFDEKYQPHLSENRDRIMRNIAGRLKPGGRILIMDPHPFWLSAWTGTPQAPVLMMTEYRTRRFKVSPRLQEISDLAYGCDLRIRRIIEPDIDPAYADIDPLAHAVMHEFPQWWMIELEQAGPSR